MTTHLHMQIRYEQWIRFYTTLLLNGGGAQGMQQAFLKYTVVERSKLLLSIQ